MLGNSRIWRHRRRARSDHGNGSWTPLDTLDTGERGPRFLGTAPVQKLSRADSRPRGEEYPRHSFGPPSGQAGASVEVSGARSRWFEVAQSRGRGRDGLRA
jgi:hypothetical protein